MSPVKGELTLPVQAVSGQRSGDGGFVSPPFVKDILPALPKETNSSQSPEALMAKAKLSAEPNPTRSTSPESVIKPISLGSVETLSTVASRNATLRVSSMNSTIDKALHSWNNSTTFSQEISHDILMFLLWTRRYGLDEAIAKADRLCLPLPLSFCEAIASFVNARDAGRLRLVTGGDSIATSCPSEPAKPSLLQQATPLTPRCDL
jgi:hypothetical protein